MQHVRKRFAGLFVAALACMPLLAESQQVSSVPSSTEVEVFLEAQNAAALHDSTQKFMLDTFRKNPFLAELLPGVEELMRTELAYEQIKPHLIAIYQANFTRAEILALTEFYSSEVGRALVAKQWTVNQQLSREIGQRMEKRMPELMKQMQERMRSPSP